MLARLEERGKELRQLSQEQGRFVQPFQIQTREEPLDTGPSALRDGLKHTDFPSYPGQSLANAALWLDDREPARARTPVSMGEIRTGTQMYLPGAAHPPQISSTAS